MPRASRNEVQSGSTHSIRGGSEGRINPPPTPVCEILVIDEDPLTIQLVTDALEEDFVKVRGATDATSGLKSIALWRPDIVFLNLVMAEVSGLEFLERILRMDPGIDVIIVTTDYSTASAVEAIQKGAYDYLTKPLPIENLRLKVNRWLSDAKHRQQTLRLDCELVEAFQFEGIIGRSPALLEMFSKIRRIAPHFQTALITGETGTGKELVAKALHRLSPRSTGPFIVCNCAAIPETLFESELFGHVRGSFTSALKDKVGFAEAASGGTLFLDEIGEIPIGAQAKLLRLLQNREVQRVGAPYSRQIDVRIVAATNRDLRALTREGKMREDLYYRLATVEIKLPRLADRKEDLPLLLRHFVELFSVRYRKPGLCLSRRAQAAMAAYSWPGNIRELESAIGYCCMMAEKEMIDTCDLPEPVQRPTPHSTSGDGECLTLEAAQMKHVLYVLNVAAGGNLVRGAAMLGVSRATLYRSLAKTKGRANQTSAASASPVSSLGFAL
jgi:DNA-binding NtrC family response regulator